MQFTIYFDGQFWVGVLERRESGKLYALRHVFGPEPTEPEVNEFVHRHFLELMDKMTVGVTSQIKPLTLNPKRLARQTARAITLPGLSTAVHTAIQEQLQANRRERKQISRAMREEEMQRRYRLTRAKAKQRHRGR